MRRGNHVRRDEPLLDGRRDVIGSFEDFEDVDLDEVTPLSLAVLQMCIDAYTVGLPDGRGALSRRGPSECTVDGRLAETLKRRPRGGLGLRTWMAVRRGG